MIVGCQWRRTHLACSAPGRPSRGSISVVKRRNGLNRCRYKTEAGMQRWVGLGVIADNLVNIGHVMSTRAAP
jgi:hypothetical protein